MSFTSKGTVEILLAGLQDSMLVVDLNKGEVTKQVSIDRSPEFYKTTINTSPD